MSISLTFSNQIQNNCSIYHKEPIIVKTDLDFKNLDNKSKKVDIHLLMGGGGGGNDIKYWLLHTLTVQYYSNLQNYDKENSQILTKKSANWIEVEEDKESDHQKAS